MPAKNICPVTEASHDILSGKELVPTSSSSPGLRRVVRSFAPVGTSQLAEWQWRAYKARKKTVFRREMEDIHNRLGRCIESVMITTWALRPKMQIRAGREVEYRTSGRGGQVARGRFTIW